MVTPEARRFPAPTGVPDRIFHTCAYAPAHVNNSAPIRLDHAGPAVETGSSCQGSGRPDAGMPGAFALKDCARNDDDQRVNLSQLTAAHRGALEALTTAATERTAEALAMLVGQPVNAGYCRFRIDSLNDTVQMIETLPAHLTIVYLEVTGDIPAQMLLLLPRATASIVINALLPDPEEVGLALQRLREDAFGEVGNIVLSAYLNTIVDATGLSAEPSPPLVGSDSGGAALELPLARAAGDQDVVVSFDTTLSIGDPSSRLRAPFHVFFLPAPGGLARVLRAVDAPGASQELRIPVRMGEMVVSNRPGDVLVANALGSCIAVALVDRLAGVAAMAHVMLPVAPDVRMLSGNPTYAARYANTAIPALIEAIERAGGRRSLVRTYIAGGGQMFSGALARSMDVPDRNVAAVNKALAAHGLRVHGDETGGTVSRTLELDVANGTVTALIDGSRRLRLDAA